MAATGSESGVAQPNRLEFNEQQITSAFQQSLKRWDFQMGSQETDLNNVLEQFADILEEKIRQMMNQYTGIKVALILTVEYHSQNRPDLQPFNFYLRTSNYVIYQASDILTTIPQLNKEICARNENVVRNTSNITIQNIHYLTIIFSRFEPLAASGYQPLPKFLANKKAIVNVKNRDNRCFAYALMSALKPNPIHPSRQTRICTDALKKYKLHDIAYPVQPTDIPQLEEKLKLKINLFSFYDDEGRARYPLYISQQTEFTQEIDLLYWNEHYAWIKTFSAFIWDLAGGHRGKYFCKRCFGLFLSKVTYDRHQEICSRPNFESVIYRFPLPKTYLKFFSVRNQLPAPFVIYADFECLLMPTNDGAEDPIPQAGPPLKKRKQRTQNYSKHIPCAVGLYIVPSSPTFFTARYETYTGVDVVDWFLNRLLTIEQELGRILKDEKKLVMTAEDWKLFNEATQCSICNGLFNDPLDRVRDHDHLTGKFRGVAHNNCNLQLQQTKKIPVFLHNFRGYDSHLITLGISAFKNTPVRVIGQGYEKYLIMTFGWRLIFKDSFQFLSCSLEQLGQDLLKAGEDKFQHLKQQSPNLTLEQFRLLTRKGVYPYEYMDSWERLDEPTLPAIKDFHNTLKQAECSPQEYSHAERVWKEFNCKNMKEYQDLYLKTDVLILADVFENFRQLSLHNYRLDPAHYVSSPHLSWDAMLLDTGCRLELISDPEQFALCDRGMRGGVSMIVHRYARANNPEMGDIYDTQKPLSYIVYFDANNLYGWAMNQSLPYEDFQFLSEDEGIKIDWLSLADDSPIGYIIECDLHYPQELHDAHNDLPLAPEKRLIHYELLNDTQLRILSHYNIPKSSLKVQKLIPHLLDRYNYVVHYRNLKFYLEEGMQVTKIYRVLRFKQSRWLESYIQKNSNLRAAAKTDFDKNQYKLYNNSIYGKTCENQKKRSDIRLVKSKEACKRLIELPHYKGHRIFDENLAAIDLRKIEAKIDKPFYVGFVVLELSKLHMYKFHYRYIKKNFGDKAQLLFTDTDSLMYHINETDPWPLFWRDRKEYFDFASYAKTQKYYDPQNNKVIGMFKDEVLGKQIIEFVGLRPKMYSYITNDQQVSGKHTAKGIQYAVAKNLTHEQYLQQLNNPHENRLVNRRIGPKLHRLYSIQTNKRGLCSFDDKRVILEDGISTMAYGHYKITGDVVNVGLLEARRQKMDRRNSISTIKDLAPNANMAIARLPQRHSMSGRIASCEKTMSMASAQNGEIEAEREEDDDDEIDINFRDPESGWDIA